MTTQNRRMFSTTDLMLMAVIAVVGSLLAVFVFNPLILVPFPVFLFLGPISWVGLSGLFLITPVLIGLLIQRPGVATVYGLVQGLLEMLFGNPSGPLSILYAGLEGLGVDLSLALFRWRANLPGALLAGAVGNLIVIVVYIPVFGLASAANFIVGGIVAVISGALLGGLPAWLIAQALHRTGVTAGLGRKPYEEIK